MINHGRNIIVKIVIDARTLRTSTGRYIERLIHYLQKIDNKNDYVILLKSKDFDSWQPSNSHFKKVICPYKEYTFAEQIGFKKQLESLHPDLVHFAMVQQPVWYNSSPVVTTMQDLTTVRFRNPDKNPVVFWIKQQIYKWVNKKVAKKSSHIITISNFVKNDLIKFTGVNPEKITVTLESADELPKGNEPADELIGKKFIMYIGRPTPHKNLRRLIDAFALLQEKYPDLTLALAGKKDSNYARHETYVNEHGIKNVVFTGFISDEQLRWMYENTAVYCFPSLSEGFGLPGLEAMLHGAPVASSTATCLPETHGDAAHYFDPFSVEDIAKSIDDILSDDKLRNELVKKGKKHVKTFSWQRMAEQTLAVYEKYGRKS